MTERIPDWDELMASGEIEATADERMQARMRVLWREAEAAILVDIEYSIKIARASSEAREKMIDSARRGESAYVDETPEDRRRRQARNSARRARARDRAARAAAATAQSTDDLGREEASEPSRGIERG